MAKVVVLLSPTQRVQLLQIPDTFSEREITRYYSLSSEDLAVIEQHRRPQNRLGFTVQLAYLRFPGRPWDPQEQVPPAILTYLVEQIGEAPDVLADYASRDPTRREHLSEIQRIFQFHPFTMQTYRDLSRWLTPIVLSTNQGMVLMEALIEELPQHPLAMIAQGSASNVAILAGTNRDEWRLFAMMSGGPKVDEELLKQLFGDAAEPALAVYTEARADKLPELAWIDIMGDMVFRIPEIHLVEAQVRYGCASLDVSL